MTALIVGLTVAVALLGVLVAGLLRANAEVIRSLHQMGINLGADAPGSGPTPATPVALRPRPTPGRPDAGDVIDLVGATPDGDAVSLAVSGVRHDTLIAFLTSGCQTCRGFWDAFRAGAPDVPGGARLVVTTRGPEAESRGSIGNLAGGGRHTVPVVMSSEAWEHYDVPYAPYFVYISGPAGRVVGEGVAATWDEVRALVANAVADGTTGPRPPAAAGRPRSRADRARDLAVDRALEEAGITPGDPRLHPAPIDSRERRMTDSRTAVAALGMAVVPPSGWEVAIYRRAPGHGEQTFPVLHGATIPLPAERGDYGSGVVELLGPDDVFVALLEFGPQAAESRLFAGLHGVPGLTPDAYRPNQLQRAIRGQAGVQRFFTTSGRAFCLYSVIGAFANRVAMTGRANAILGTIRVAEPQLDRAGP